MQAVGIHDHATMKCGLRPPKTGMPRLRLGDFLTGAVPDHPATLDYLTGGDFGLYGNDQFGVCGPTSVANYRRLVTAKLTGTMQAPTQADVFDLYRRSGNPNFDPATGADDNGVNMQDMLSSVVAGGIGGVKAIGFASVDVSNLDEMAAAIAIVGGLLIGVNLQTAQQAQTAKGFWDYSPSRAWGGHAILDGGYGPKGEAVISWAKELVVTLSFLQHQLSEAWVVLWPEHLQSKFFMAGMDMTKFAAAYTAMTGKPFPVVVPPKPPVPPAPIPPPAPPGSYSVTLSSVSPIRVSV